MLIDPRGRIYTETCQDSMGGVKKTEQLKKLCYEEIKNQPMNDVASIMFSIFLKKILKLTLWGYLRYQIPFVSNENTSVDG